LEQLLIAHNVAVPPPSQTPALGSLGHPEHMIMGTPSDMSSIINETRDDYEQVQQ